MRIRNALFTMLAGLALAAAASGAHAQAREEGRLLMASEILEELRASKDQAIPERLLDHHDRRQLRLPVGRGVD